MLARPPPVWFAAGAAVMGRYGTGNRVASLRCSSQQYKKSVALPWGHGVKSNGKRSDATPPMRTSSGVESLPRGRRARRNTRTRPACACLARAIAAARGEGPTSPPLPRHRPSGLRQPHRRQAHPPAKQAEAGVLTPGAAAGRPAGLPRRGLPRRGMSGSAPGVGPGQH